MIGIDQCNVLCGKVESLLEFVESLKTQERSNEQRKIAILYSKVEDCFAWAKHTVES